MSINNNKIRDESKIIIGKNIKLSQIELDDLEIGIFNASLDYAVKNNVQLSWQSQHFVDIYSNIFRSIYTNLVSTTYINNKNLYQRLKKRSLCHMNWHICQEKSYIPKNGI